MTIQVTDNFLYLLKPCKVLKSFHSIRLEQCGKMYGTEWSTYSDREFQLQCRHGGWCKKFRKTWKVFQMLFADQSQSFSSFFIFKKTQYIDAREHAVYFRSVVSLQLARPT